MTMIEKVARALIEHEWGADMWGRVSEGSREQARERARAAILAMREPTDAMVGAYDALFTWDDDGRVPTPHEAMNSMIDAALSDHLNKFK